MSTEEPVDDAQPTVLETRLAVPNTDADLATDRLWTAGAQAVEEVDLPGDGLAQPRIELRTVLADTESETRERIGPLPADWRLDFVRRSLLPAQTWRAFCQPIVISQQLTVVPAWWDGHPVAHDRQVLIEPGAAFGLGDHPTTRLMLEVLDELGQVESGLRGQTVLDVGTGTGVLAVVAARSGAEVVAIDVAPAAVEATTNNAALNQVTFDVSTTPVGDVDAGFDVVLANILAPTLVSIAEDLVRLTRPTGTLVVSGLLADRYEHVVEALSPLRVVDVRERMGWVAVVLRQPERPSRATSIRTESTGNASPSPGT